MVRIQLRMADALQKGKESNVGFHLSTFDIPKEATADIDKASGLVTFHFIYVDHEPVGPTQRLDDDISIDCGRNSGKLLAVRINAKRYPAGQIDIKFQNAIKGIRNLRVHQRENFNLVNAVISENRKKVESAIETP